MGQSTDRRPRLASILPGVILAVAAALAAVALLTAALTGAVGLRVALIPTGSMEPAIAAGSAALVRTVPADEVQVGDVVTVERADDVPVAHRIIDVDDPDGEAESTRDLTLRGDANAVPDPGAYRVEEVGLILAILPGGANVVTALRSPWVLGALVIGVASIVVLAVRMRGHADGSDDPVDVGRAG